MPGQKQLGGAPGAERASKVATHLEPPFWVRLLAHKRSRVVIADPSDGPGTFWQRKADAKPAQVPDVVLVL